MPNFLQLNTLGWRDAVDVAVVAVIVYYILLAIRGTRAVQILLGIVVLLVFQALSFYLKLQSTYFVLRALVLSIVVALPIVFQPELRRALMQLGGTMRSPFQHVRHDVLVKIVDEISWAANLLSQTRTGALIVIERETGLEEYIETGVAVNAEVSSKLLLSIFQKTSPLHDGAVILRADKVVAASCYLPLSEIRLTTHNVHSGTRHRAALGLSEQTDAVVVVVSEESGDISVAREGHFSYDESEETLKRRLLETLSATGSNGSIAPVTLKRLDGWIPWRRKRPTAVVRTVDAASVPLEPQPTEQLEESARPGSPTTPPAARGLPSAAAIRDEDTIAEKQRQTEKAVEKRASEAKRREEERRKEDESRKPEGEDVPPASAQVAMGTRPPSAGHAAPTAPRIEDTWQGRQ